MWLFVSVMAGILIGAVGTLLTMVYFGLVRDPDFDPSETFDPDIAAVMLEKPIKGETRRSPL